MASWCIPLAATINLCPDMGKWRLCRRYNTPKFRSAATILQRLGWSRSELSARSAPQRWQRLQIEHRAQHPTLLPFLLRSCYPAQCCSRLAFIIMSNVGETDFDQLTRTLTENFNLLADEVQLLSDRKTVLEHKLRFAHEQVCLQIYFVSAPLYMMIHFSSRSGAAKW